MAKDTELLCAGHLHSPTSLTCSFSTQYACLPLRATRAAGPASQPSWYLTCIYAFILAKEADRVMRHTQTMTATEQQSNITSLNPPSLTGLLLLLQLLNLIMQHVDYQVWELTAGFVLQDKLTSEDSKVPSPLICLSSPPPNPEPTLRRCFAIVHNWRPASWWRRAPPPLMSSLCRNVAHRGAGVAPSSRSSWYALDPRSQAYTCLADKEAPTVRARMLENRPRIELLDLERVMQPCEVAGVTFITEVYGPSATRVRARLTQL